MSRGPISCTASRYDPAATGSTIEHSPNSIDSSLIQQWLEGTDPPKKTLSVEPQVERIPNEMKMLYLFG